MSEIRTSYTILEMFDKGNFDDAMLCQFGLWSMLPTNKAMLAGREWHDKWAKESVATKSLPSMFGGKKLNNPAIEQKLEAKVSDDVLIVFKPDLVDEPTIFEYKTGIADSSFYLSKRQLPLYAALLERLGQTVEAGQIIHYNQHTDQTDVSYIWLTKKEKDEALAWAIDVARKMKDYIEENKVTKETIQAIVFS